jgi:hypothetical protein
MSASLYDSWCCLTLRLNVALKALQLELPSQSAAAHLSLSAATSDLKMSVRWSKGTHCGASSRSAAREAGRPPAAASLQGQELHYNMLVGSSCLVDSEFFKTRA